MWKGTPTLQLWRVVAPKLSYHALECHLKCNQGAKNVHFLVSILVANVLLNGACIKRL